MKLFERLLEEIRPIVGNEIFIITDGLVSTEVRNLLIGGKRLRAGIVWSIANQYISEPTAYKVNMITDLACAVELAHASSLIVDDMLDEDSTRRGVKTLHIQFGHKKAMLATIGLLSIPYMVVGKYSTEFVEQLSKTQHGMVAGALTELKPTKRLPATAVYEYVIARKTGMLFRLAARYGAMAAELEPDTIELFARYGSHVGKAMQIADDIADLHKILVGEKDGNFGSEMILLKCVCADHLFKELLTDIKNKTLKLRKVPLLWENAGMQVALHNMLEQEINKSLDVLDLIGDVDEDSILYQAPQEITRMMLAEVE